MSSYFDDFDRQVRQFANDYDDDGFLQCTAEAEQAMFEDVAAVTGDREFPHDLRERIMNAFAIESVKPTPTPLRSAIEYVLRTRSSRVSGTVHSLFHELASRRIQTRFGLLSDDPYDIFVRRAEWEDENCS